MEINIKKAIGIIHEGVNKEKIFINPIKNHPITKQSIEIQEMYFILLCIIGNINSELNKNQRLFLERLIITSENNENIENYYKKTNSLENNFIKNFAEKFQKSDIKYNLLIDVLIMIGLSSEKTEEQISTCSDIFLILDIKLDKIKLGSKIAKSILEQDEKIIISMIEVENNLLEYVVCYISNFYAGPISFNRELIYLLGDENKKTPFSSLKKYMVFEENNSFANSLQLSFEQELLSKSKIKISLNSKRIIIKNYFSTNENLEILICCNENIIIENTNFENVLGIPIKIDNCENVILKNCLFKNIKYSLILINRSSSINICNSTFENIQSSRLIDFKNIQKFEIRKNIFNKISFKQLSEAIFTIDTWPNSLYIDNNVFENCKNMSSYGSLLIFSSIDKDFNNKLNIINNLFNDCYSNSIIKINNPLEEDFSSNKINNETQIV